MAKVIALKDTKAMNLPGRRAREMLGAGQALRLRPSAWWRSSRSVPANAARGPHVHHGFEECIHVLTGEGLTRTDEGEHPVAAGDTVLVPAEQRHATYNTGTGLLRLLCFFPVNDIRPGTVEFASWDSGEGT